MLYVRTGATSIIMSIRVSKVFELIKGDTKKQQ